MPHRIELLPSSIDEYVRVISYIVGLFVYGAVSWRTWKSKLNGERQIILLLAFPVFCWLFVAIVIALARASGYDWIDLTTFGAVGLAVCGTWALVKLKQG